MKQYIISFILTLLALTSLGQSTNTRQIRFFPIVTAGDSTASVANDGRVWYDFSTDEYRGIRNGVAFSFGIGGTSITTASNGLTLTGSNVTWGGSLTGTTTISGAQTVNFTNSLNTFTSGGLSIFNPGNTFSYNIVGSALAANRTITLPLLTSGDIFTFNDFAATLTNKTLGTGTTHSAIPTINDGITFTFNPNATVSGLNIGQQAGNPSTIVNGNIWYNSSLNYFGLHQASATNMIVQSQFTLLAPTQITYGATGSNTNITSEAAFIYDAATNRLTADNATFTTNLRGNYLTSGRIPYITTSGTITDAANLTFNGTSQVAIGASGGINDGVYLNGGTTFGSIVGGSELQVIGTTTLLINAFGSDLTLQSGGGTGDDLIIETGNGSGTLKINDGANEQSGIATLVGGTITINNTKVTANTRIHYSRDVAGGTLGHLSITARVAGTSFTIGSTSGTETSTIVWWLAEPN